MNRHLVWMVYSILAFQLSPARQASAAYFVPLGHLPSGSVSAAQDVSADGSVVVGFAGDIGWYDYDVEAFRWTRDGGMIGLGNVPGTYNSRAAAVSADGATVVGSCILCQAGAFRWTQGSGMDRLVDGSAEAVSANGSVVVINADVDGEIAAFRWTSDGGIVGLGDLPGGHVRSHARDISADGSVIVGWSHSGVQEAFRWTSEEGMVGLGEVPGVRENFANAVSADGSVIVGGSYISSGAFRWTRETGLVRLGDGEASDVSADGNIVVGTRYGENQNFAFIYDAIHGMRSVSEVLLDLGVDVTGWRLVSTAAISADGTAIVGMGINPAGQTEAWLANISVPEPTTGATLLAAATLLAGSCRSTIRHRSSRNGSRAIYSRPALVCVLLLAPATTSRADIFRWDNGQLIPGTEGIVPAPGVELVSLALEFAELSGLDLTTAYLDAVNLERARLLETDLTGALMKSTTLEGANLSRANLHKATLLFVNMNEADFTDAHVNGTFFVAPTFSGFTKEQLYSTASYQAKDLSGTVFWGAHTYYFVDNGADFTGGSFSHQNLTGGGFVEANLTSADLTDANLTNASFEGTTLSGADLSRAVVRGASFAKSDLSQHQLYATRSYQSKDLAGIGLGFLDLSGWDLRGQDLRNANFQAATFRNVNLQGASIAGARFDSTTDLGRGFTKESLYSTASYQAKDLRGISFYEDLLSEWDFRGQNLSGASFQWSVLLDADFTDALIAGADFTSTRALSAAQIYSTVSYQTRELSRLGLINLDLTNWNFSGQNLQDAAFLSSQLEGAVFSGADLRGATDLQLDAFQSSNAILSDGKVAGLVLEAGESFLIRDDDGVPDPAPRTWLLPRAPLPLAIQTRLEAPQGSLMQLRFDADNWDSLVTFEGGITVELGGTLALTFADEVDVAGQVGRTLRIFDWAGVTRSGTFAISSPYQWDTSNLYTTGEITLISIPEPTSLQSLLLGIVMMLYVRAEFGFGRDGMSRRHRLPN